MDGCTLTANNGISVTPGNSLTIYGQTGGTGTLTANGDSLSAGIGGGNMGHGGNITISGGTVTATGSGGGAGIGGGEAGDGGTFSTNITDSESSNTTYGSAVIYASSISDQSGKAANAPNPWSGIIFEGNDGKVYGNQTLTEAFTIDKDKALTVSEGVALTVSENASLTNSGTIYVDGTLTNNGTMSGSGGVYYPLTLTNCTATSSVETHDEKTYGRAGSAITLTPDTPTTDQVFDHWEVTGASISGNSFTMPSGPVTVTAVMKTISSVSITNDPGKVYDGQPVSVVGKYTVKGDGTVTVEYKAKDAEDATYTPSAPTDAGSYTVRVSVAASDNYTADSATKDFTITKASQTAPSAPTVKSKTWNSVTLEAIPDNANGAAAQYSVDGGTTWQDSPEFTGLSASTEYSFVARYRETDNYFASPVSDPVAVTTNNVPVPTYPPAVEQPEDGTVTVSPTNPIAGSRVTVTPTPDGGCEVDAVTVTDRNGNPVEVTDNGDGTYTFKQPSGKVTVTFKPEKDPVKDCDKDGTCALSRFTDVDPAEWYHDGIHYCIEKGLMQGTGPDTFEPEIASTRGMLMTVLVCFDGVDTTGGDRWYEKGMEWAVENGISDGSDPDDLLTREQLMTMLFRYAKYKGYDVNARADITSFVDSDTTSGWAEEAMSWAVAEKLINGIEGNQLAPGGDAVRAQLATILYRFCENVIQ